MVEQMTETLREEFEHKEKEEQIISENNVVVSVSFGRFENDLLSWERWSSFSQNKYLEEVEKCSTPGSVASKKAYFEAHYKKIAAKKAELLEQEQLLEHDSLRLNYPSNRNQVENSSNFEFGTHHADGVSSTHTYEPNQVVDGEDCEDLFSLEMREATDSQQGRSISEKSDVAVLVKEENLSTGSNSRSEEVALATKEENNLGGSQAQVEELPICIKDENYSAGTQGESQELPVLVKEENNSSASHARFEELNVQVKEEVYSSGSRPKTRMYQVNKAVNTKVKPREESKKRTPASQEKNLVKTKKKPIPKPAQTSAPGAEKPSPASPVISTSRNTTKRESSPFLLSKKNLSTTGSKRSTSTSLHMSLNMAPTNTDSSFLNTMRSSLIMERMGDEEIVKRAFKPFQHTYRPSKSYIRGVSSAPQQVSEKGMERVASSMTPRKDKERKGTPLGKASHQRKDVGARSNSLSAGPIKAAGVNQTSAKAAPSSFGLRNEERVEKQREKKLDEKSKPEEVKSTHLRPKSKEGATTRTPHQPESWR